MKIVLASLLCLFWLLGMPRAEAAPMTEPQKIEALLASIEHLQGAVFIRNGSEYSAAQAVEHLRYKWNKAGDRVKTAEDFIVLVASKSSMSGLAYRIRFADGRVVDTATFLGEQLRRLPSGPG